MEKEHFVALFLCALIGSVAGFFVFNYHPARVYMGDAGSYFIGYVLASATVMGTYYRPQSSTLFTILVPVLILGVPLYDLSSVIFIRLYRGQSIFKGDRQHFSHRIADCGISHRGVALFLYLVSFSFGISSLLLESVPENKIILIFLQTLGFASIIALMEYFGRRKSR